MKNNQTFYTPRQKFPSQKEKELKRSGSTQNQIQMPKLVPKNYSHNNNTNQSPPSTKEYFYISSYSPNINSQKVNYQNQQLEIESLRDKVLKIKAEYNLKLREIHELKVNYNKLNDDNRTYIKIIETMLKKANKNSPEKISNDINDLLETGDFSDKSINGSLKETMRIINLKKQMNDYRKQIELKDIEINNYKQNIKVTKLNELEVNLLKKEGENDKLMKENENLRIKIDFLEKKLNEAYTNLEYCKTLNNQQNGKIKELNSMIDAKIKEESVHINNRNNLEGKISENKHTICSLKSQIKEKDETINKLTREKENISQFKTEKENYEKNEQANKKKIKNLTNENEKLSLKINMLTQENHDYITKLSFYEKERNKYLPLMKEPQASNKEKNKKIKELEEQNEKISKEKEKIQKNYENLQKINEELTERKNENDSKITNLENEIRNYKNKEEQSKKETEDLKKKITSLEEQNIKSQQQNTPNNKEEPPNNNERKEVEQDDLINKPAKSKEKPQKEENKEQVVSEIKNEVISPNQS